MVLVTQGLKSSFSLKGQLVTNNRKISDARPLILVTSFMHYISCLTKKNKSKKIFNNVAFQELNVVVCFHYNFLSYSKCR